MTLWTCRHCQFSAETKRNLGIHLQACKARKVEDMGVGNALEKWKMKKKRKHEVAVEESRTKRQAREIEALGGSASHDIDLEMGSDNDVPASFDNDDSPLPAEVAVDHPVADNPLATLESRTRIRRPTWKILQAMPFLRKKRRPTPLTTDINDTYIDDNSHDEDVLLSDAGSHPVEGQAAVEQSSVPRKSIFRTLRNRFGLYREYLTKPTYNHTLDDSSPIDPDPNKTPPPSHTTPLNVPHLPQDFEDTLSPYHPFANEASFNMLQWQWTGSSNKSDIEVDRLLHLLKTPGFSFADLQNMNRSSEVAKVDAFINGESLPSQSGDSQPHQSQWKEASVPISIPDGKSHPSIDDAPVFEVNGLHYRLIVEVIRSMVSDPDLSRGFHYTPFREYYQHPSNPPNINSTGADTQHHSTRLYGEIFSSDAMLKAHEELQAQPPEPGCELERVVLALMLYSDSTHLAQFGTASAWPAYLQIGNQLKGIRTKPQTGSCHHVAYIPKLPDSFFEFVVDLTGDGPSTELLTHVRRELMHAVWRILLDDQFMEAYKHGVVIRCPDGIERRFYPRLLTYSADYPEKALLATIRNLAACLCPRCLVTKDQVSNLGTKADDQQRVDNARVDDYARQSRVNRVRNWIYLDGETISGTHVEGVLKPKSEVPTVNAFSEQLSAYGLSYFDLFVPDLLHEIELGTWKSLFTHLLCILVVCGEGTIQRLNATYRDIPTFGRSTIRRFTNNVSAMKKLAARDFEDLRASVPFQRLKRLLFTFASWHALAKLRIHTDETLTSLQQATVDLGRQLRNFQKNTCAAFETKELPNEEAARSRRRSRKATGTSKSSAKATQPKSTMPDSTSTKKKAQRKVFNLSTYKFHSMGDYVRTIRNFGTTDSYSTQTGELQHRSLKQFYIRTSKNKPLRQMAKHEARQRLVHLVSARVHRIFKYESVKGRFRTQAQVLADESKPYSPPQQHHVIGSSLNAPRNLYNFVMNYPDDPAVIDFIPKLKQHLLSRLLHPDEAVEDEHFNREDWSKITILGDRVYVHRTFRVNFTTYDFRSDQDTINPRTRADIMTLKRHSTNTHPYSYARVLSIFHLKAQHDDPMPDTQEVEVLWVQWFQVDSKQNGGLRSNRLPRLEFQEDSGAFGFLDPNDVIRASHIIPAFAYGGTMDRLGHSIARQCFHGSILESSFTWPKDEDIEKDDYCYYYANVFVDRDMFMRYYGGGIGHYKVQKHTPMDELNSNRDSDLPGPSIGEDGNGEDATPQVELDTSDSDSSSGTDTTSSSDASLDEDGDGLNEESALGFEPY